MLWLQDSLCVLLLILCHWLAPLLSKRTQRDQEALASLGGGISLAYVFLHLLPQLNGPLHRQLLCIALLGIAIPYTLNAMRAQRSDDSSWTGQGRLMNFAIINYVYAYSLPTILNAHLSAGVLYVTAIGAHILMADRTMAMEHPLIFRRRLRWIGSGSLIAGSLHSAVLQHLIGHSINNSTIAYASAFVAGGLIMTVFHEELPNPSASRAKWFLLGLATMTGLLLGLMLD